MLVKFLSCIIVVAGLSCARENVDSITVEGIAMDAKAGAVIITEMKGTYYLDGMSNWKSDEISKKFRVTGRLVFEQGVARDSKGMLPQGVDGERKIIKEWKFVD